MPRPLQVELLNLKVVSESRVTLATSVPILVFLGLSGLELGPMYATDVRCASSLNASALWRRGHNNANKRLVLIQQNKCHLLPHVTCASLGRHVCESLGIYRIRVTFDCS